LFLGDYFKKNKNFKKAIHYYQQALKHDVSSLQEENAIHERISESKK
jgi:isopenicillin-N N-acyltransferase-like protein